MRRRSRVASVRAVRGHQRHFGDVLPSLRRAARRPCRNGCSRCCAGGRDRSGEDACADETGRTDRPVDRRSGIRCRRQACSRVCAGTGIGCRAARCILARFDAGGRSGSDDERRRTAARSAASRCTAAASDERYAGHRCGRPCADRSSARSARGHRRRLASGRRRRRLLRIHAHDHSRRDAGVVGPAHDHGAERGAGRANPRAAHHGVRTIDKGARTTDDVVGRHRPARHDGDATGWRSDSTVGNPV